MHAYTYHTCLLTYIRYIQTFLHTSYLHTYMHTFIHIIIYIFIYACMHIYRGSFS